MRKDEVQCIGIYARPHRVHETWMKAVSSRVIYPYVPSSLMWTLKFPLLSQLIAFFRGFSTPKAKVYLIEAAATVPAMLFRKGTVISINSDTFFYNMKNGSWLVKLYSKLLLKRIDGFISTSEYMRKQATKPSEVVYPFMENTELFGIHPRFENDAICNIAGMRHSKGTDVLVKTFELYKKSHPDARLYALGESENEEWISEVEHVGGIAPGNVSVGPYLKKCSIYINPARHEPFGVNVVEAMAAGIPPLVSEYCGAAELASKVDKRLVTSLDPREIAKKIEWLRSDRKKYYAMSKKCKALAKTLTKQKSIKEFEEKFTRLLERVS